MGPCIIHSTPRKIEGPPNPRLLLAGAITFKWVATLLPPRPVRFPVLVIFSPLRTDDDIDPNKDFELNTSLPTPSTKLLYWMDTVSCLGSGKF
jgi:hypothetical protein